MTKTYLGNCQDEDLIESIFGSVSEFARLTEEHGDNFTHHYSMLDRDGVRVEYDEENDIHSFYADCIEWHSVQWEKAKGTPI